MPEWDGLELTEDERRLAEELTTYGPLLGRIARARREKPDPAFLLSLRATFAGIEPARPTPAFERRLRRRLIGLRPAIYRPLGAIGALVVAAVVALVLIRGGAPKHTNRPLAAGIPHPSTADLIWGFPAIGVSGGGGGYLTPTASRIAVNGGTGYPKRLHLQLSSVPTDAGTLAVYRLAAQPPYAATFVAAARRLGISGSATCMSPTTAQRSHCGAGEWRVVAQNLFPSRLPLKSLAFSIATGETLYHDTRYDPLTYRGAALRPQVAEKTARRWLASLGWPGNRMPVLGVTQVREIGPPGKSAPSSIQFGWGRGIRANRPAATVWVAPIGTVIEADLWPPIERRRVVPARTAAAAFQTVQSGAAPVAVENAPLASQTSGSGRASQVSLVDVLVTPPHGPSYLVPAYRFSGRVRLTGPGRSYPWYALSSAVTK
jgi:hypothetical protein